MIVSFVKINKETVAGVCCSRFVGAKVLKSYCNRIAVFLYSFCLVSNNYTRWN